MADINKTIEIDVVVDTQNLDKTAQGVEKVTKATENNTKSLDHNKKGLLENGGAMGLLGAATGGLAMDFKDAIEAIEGTGLSLKGLRGALIATGIGALAIVLLELVTNWEKWNGILSGSAKLLENFNASLISFDQIQKSTKVSLDATVASLENELAILQAQGASQDLILKKTLEINDAKKAYYDLSIPQLESEVALLKQAVDTDSERNKILNEVVIATIRLNASTQEARQEARDDLKNASARLTIYDNENEIVKKLSATQDLVSQAKIDRDKTETSSSVAKFAEEKRLREEALANEKKYLTESIAFIKKYYDIINASGKALTEIDNSKYGKVFADMTKLNKLADDLIEANDKVTQKIEEAAKRQREMVASGAYSDKEYNELKKQLKDLFKDSDAYREKAQIAKDLAEKKNDIIFTEQAAVIIGNEKIIEQYDEINKLKLEEYELNNKLFQYEKSVDGRLDNSNKFDEIQRRINKSYENRIEVIEKTKLAEREVLQEKQDMLVADSKQLMSDASILAAKIDGEIKLTDAEKERLKELDNERKLSGQTQDQMLRDKLAKAIDVDVQISENSVAIAQNTSDLMIEIATTTSDKELEIEATTWDKRKLMRDEALDREQQYKNAVMGIASESQNFVDALITNGHLKGKKAAEDALALRKVIGVANVVITGQEEIRGIWANPSLTALPDTGVVSKGLLTAAAVARAGLSIATILAQKLTGGSSGNNSSSGTANAPQASFNIVGSSTTNQLAATIAAQQQQPVKAYVVGTDMTTQQALDRNITNNATFL